MIRLVLGNLVTLLQIIENNADDNRIVSNKVKLTVKGLGAPYGLIGRWALAG